jgi:hypothetical protein
MPTPLDRLFQSDANVGTHQWNVEVFRRAYLYPGSPFERVMYRISAGFSVLVYLPGNCMRAAAELLRGQQGELSNVAWKQYGLADGNTKTIADVWRAYSGLLESLTAWISGANGARPYAIFHNLDMLADSHGGLDMSNEAKTALFYLTECSRSGVVLGLSDLSAGQLPEALRRPFGEEVWLEEIPVSRFPYLVPLALGEKLASGDCLPDGPAHLLASRLRWTDPCRSVRIMSKVSTASSIGDALVQVTAHTRSVEFSDPASLKLELPKGEDRPTGYEEETITALELGVIGPFQRWACYDGNEPELQLRRLPAGIILHGPPGTGKSRLARWVASRIRIPFRQVGAADLKEADWGLTERKVRDLFRSARRAAPCMIVLDDADDLLPDREALTGGLAGAERGVVNAFLQELEGFGARLEGVLIVLTTNRFPKLDKAARSRLTLNFRIPYPLTAGQIREIVLELGRHYGIQKDTWPPEILNRLEDVFFKPMRPVQKNVELADDRRRMHADLFSPREISAAMRMMMTESGGVPRLNDVDRMERYYKGLADLGGIEPE